MKNGDTFLKSFNLLKTYCEAENYMGWDPYDGLNSKLFQITPLKKNTLARLACIQFFKRSPVNLRKLALVSKGYNPKGIALFLSGYCSLYNVNPELSCLKTIRHLANLLLSLQNFEYSGACWGYNFDWQNRVFFLPKNTPTVVVTAFCAKALLLAYDITGDKRYLNTALSCCDFVVNDLNKTELAKGEFAFSYSPLDTSVVYNASLLGARILADGYTQTKNEAWLQLCIQATNTIIRRQTNEGAWIYGEASVQNWIDSYHTAYNLDCIFEITEITSDQDSIHAFRLGFNYYIKHFFLRDGTPKYYHNKKYPIDIHSPAVLIALLAKTDKLKKFTNLSEKVLIWTIKNMQDPKGYFYYQLKPVFSSKIPYIRWAQAWMFYAFSHYISSVINENLDRYNQLATH